ncbi:MAG: hypothetical protein K2N84_04410 [Clostridia bacterium]|nr:hypothetical protein [Clostridia bacterium]
MKKLHIAFGIVLGIMTLAAIVVGCVWAINIYRDPYTSFPAWAGFAFTGIYYALALAALFAVWFLSWLIAWLILRRKACKKQSDVL